MLVMTILKNEWETYMDFHSRISQYLKKLDFESTALH